MSALQAVDFGVLIEDGSGDLVQLLSLFGKDEGFVIADEEGAAKFLLQLRNVIRDRRLADAEGGGGFAEVEALCCFAENSETVVCHNSPKVSDLFGI